MTNPPGLSPQLAYVPNIVSPASVLPGDKCSALTLGQLPPNNGQPAPQAGSSTFISDSTAAYASAAVGAVAVGGGSNLCRVYWDGGVWRIG